MYFLQNLVVTKVFHQTLGPPCIRWIHNDFIYVIFVEIKMQRLEACLLFHSLEEVAKNQ